MPAVGPCSPPGSRRTDWCNIHAQRTTIRTPPLRTYPNFGLTGIAWVEMGGRLQGHRNSAGLQGKFAALQNSHLHPRSPFQSRQLCVAVSLDSRRCDHRGAARRPRRTVDGHAQSVQLTTQIMPTTPSPHTCGPSRPGSRASATPRQLFSPGRASCGFRWVSGVLIACAEEETKAWAAMAAPGGGCGDVGTTGRPNARGLT